MTATTHRTRKEAKVTVYDAWHTFVRSGGFRAEVTFRPCDEGLKYPPVYVSYDGLSVLGLSGDDKFSPGEAEALAGRLEEKLNWNEATHQWNEFCEQIDHLAHVLRAVVAEARRT
jgi:hypothetical protein